MKRQDAACCVRLTGLQHMSASKNEEARRKFVEFIGFAAAANSDADPISRAPRAQFRKRKRVRGRPTVLTASLQTKLCEYLALGHFVKTACELTGLPEQTYYRWHRLGSDGIELYRTFYFATRRAIAQSEASAVQIIFNAATGVGPRRKRGQVRAAFMFLQCRFPQRWNRRRRSSVGSDVGDTRDSSLW